MDSENRERLLEERLDAALKQYSDIEPRSGLEGRILARVQAERNSLVFRPWRRWPASVATLFVVVTGLVFLIMWKPTRPVPGVTRSAAVSEARSQPPNVVSQPRTSVRSPLTRKVRQKRIAPAFAEPRLDQFPSPMPLGEQEEMLARYVQERPHEAMMVARARAELLKTELLKFQQPQAASDREDSEQ
jgi:hypothetical protein